MEAVQDRFNLFMHMTVYNGYPLSLVVALFLHFVILAALVWSQVSRPPEILDVIQPPMIKALTVDENPQTTNERVQRQQRQNELDAQRERDRQAELERQAELDRQREADLAQQREAEADQQRQAELDRQRQANLDRQRQAELDAQRERERQAELDRQRQAELDSQREANLAQQREAESARQRQAEEAASASAELARTERERVMAYTGVIHDLVQQNWSRPPSARNGMTVQFRLQLLPTGDIVNLEVVRSSGDYAFDRAAETAIYRVGRFTELQGMPISMFNENFRSLLLTFRPEDLLN